MLAMLAEVTELMAGLTCEWKDTVAHCCVVRPFVSAGCSGFVLLKKRRRPRKRLTLGKYKKYSKVPPHSSNPTVNKKPLLSSSLAPRYVGLRLRSAYCVSWSGDSAQAWRVPTQRPGLIGTYWGPCSQIKTYHSFHQPSPWDSVFLDVQEVRLQSSSLELWRFFHREVS